MPCFTFTLILLTSINSFESHAACIKRHFPSFFTPLCHCTFSDSISLCSTFLAATDVKTKKLYFDAQSWSFVKSLLKSLSSAFYLLSTQRKAMNDYRVLWRKGWRRPLIYTIIQIKSPHLSFQHTTSRCRLNFHVEEKKKLIFNFMEN